MKLFFILFIAQITILNGQPIKMAEPISKASLDSAYINYQKRFNEIALEELSIDVQTILIDFIPQLVLKDRKIRYAWDRQKKPLIYVYQNLITFDSVQFLHTSVLNFINEANKHAIDSNRTLKSYPYLDLLNFDLSSYTKLFCLERFPYNFIFVDHILKADFVLSTFKQNVDNFSKNLYIWHIPNLVENTIFNVKAIQPWENDCYKVEILNQNSRSINFKMESHSELEKFRNTRY
ncbi:MAG: hypothetical protein IPM42_13420 [Saprospiraceae bacterium]|nr:hypothetical protein [Saprospiraceae bacterium]